MLIVEGTSIKNTMKKDQNSTNQGLKYMSSLVLQVVFRTKSSLEKEEVHISWSGVEL